MGGGLESCVPTGVAMVGLPITGLWAGAARPACPEGTGGTGFATGADPIGLPIVGLAGVDAGFAETVGVEGVAAFSASSFASFGRFSAFSSRSLLGSLNHESPD